MTTLAVLFFRYLDDCQVLSQARGPWFAVFSREELSPGSRDDLTAKQGTGQVVWIYHCILLVC